jgi:hypothetical protein
MNWRTTYKAGGVEDVARTGSGNGHVTNEEKTNMGTKQSPGAFDCHARALYDEPMFTLLGRDQHAPALVNLWAETRQALIDFKLAPPEDQALVDEARKCAQEMSDWRKKNEGKWREKRLFRNQGRWEVWQQGRLLTTHSSFFDAEAAHNQKFSVDSLASRRNRIDVQTPVEGAIREAIVAVERVGADPRLTQAVILLSDALARVSDYVDGVQGVEYLAVGPGVPT